MKLSYEYLNSILNGNADSSATNDNKHSVIVHFVYYRDTLDPLYALEDKLEKAMKDKGVGEYDGHEIAVDESDGCLFMYGPNAEELFKAVKPILENTDFMKGAVANLRFGGIETDALEIDVEIGGD